MYGWNVVRGGCSHCPSVELAGKKQLNSSVKILSLQAKCRHVSLHTAMKRLVWPETWAMREVQFLNIALREHQTQWEERPQRHCRNGEVAGHAASASLWEAKGEHMEWALAERDPMGNWKNLFYFYSCLSCPVVRKTDLRPFFVDT